MNVLVLGNVPSPLKPCIERSGCKVIEYQERFEINFLSRHSIDFIVSYGYRHIIPKPVIDYVAGKIINLHISFLPWNRGADPNLWSFLEDTPKGVSIHYIDEGLDTGDIIAQQETQFVMGVDTLASSYNKLQDLIVKLFEEYWPLVMRGEAPRWKQVGPGSFHSLKDKIKYKGHLKAKGWDTPVKELIAGALVNTQPGEAGIDD